MRFSNPAGLWLATLAIPVVLLHILRPRRLRQPVRSTFLWTELATPVAAAQPWQRLRPSVLLFLQLLATALLALAAAQPARAEPSDLAEHTVFIIDTSASMGARDGSGDRVAAAVARAREVYADLPEGAVASVVDAGLRATVLVSASDDGAAFREALAGLEPSDGPADFLGAFALAQSLETPDVPIGYVLLSDGGLDQAARRLLPLGMRYEPIGSSATNRGLRNLSVEVRGTTLHAVVTVANTGGAAATQTVRFDVDGRTVSTSSVQIPAGGVVEVAADVPAGDRVEAFLEGEDLLDLDDHLYAVAPRLTDLSVAVYGPSDPFLDALLDTLPGITVTRSEVVLPPGDADVVVYNRISVPIAPDRPFLAIAPPGGIPGVGVAGEVEGPIISLVDGRDPLLAGVDLTDVGIARAQRIDAPLIRTIVGAEGAPLVLRGDLDGVPFVYQAFAVADSNLPLHIAFPVLGDRILRDLGGAATGVTQLTVGDRLPADVTQSVVVERPGGQRVEYPPGSANPIADRAGFWTVSVGDRVPLTVAANPPPAESDLAVEPSLPVEQALRLRGESATTGSVERSVLWWLVVPLLAVLAVEFLVARRRVGVTRRAWRMSAVLRVVVAALLLAAALDVGIVRRATDVATMFVLDASDSLGGRGRTDAVDWVREAIDAQPDGSLAGVVVFGGDARLETTVRPSLNFGTPAVVVDPTRTDLAGALRLAGAVLPTDARRRIVLVSDGRATEGDVVEQANRLRSSDIAVEYHVVGRAGGDDVAITAIEAPGLVRDGETVTIDAAVDSTTTTDAELELVRDGVVVATQTVALNPGSNRVSFTDTVTGSGVARYQVRVRAGNDDIAENDRAYRAVQIDGPPTVLLVEGRPENSATLGAALEAAGVLTRTVPATAIPPVDELAGVVSIVLVDVDARTLAADHVAALSAAVRDLGRGLVTIGGTQSYGLGGYRDSDLEDLLPVVSEILDPLRRQTVAEVLAVDTSGSMGACHCAEGAEVGGFGGNSLEGGVNKTDISRAAAARAIAALQDVDEIGVLAIDSSERWIIDLQKLPAQDVVTSGLRNLVHSEEGTNLTRSLATAAAALRESDAALKHVILFTDGFTPPGQLVGLADDAAGLLEEGITVSVVGTGEGAAHELEQIAAAGGGRYYPGRDLQQVPELIANEAVLASRDFIQEGRFLPTITSNADVVEALTATPALLGYVATTAKPVATAHLRIGDEQDPLLSSWQIGLGRVTSWTSDLERWGQLWQSWPGFVDFWATVVKDTYPTTDASGSVRAVVDGETLRVTVESADPFPDGSVATARVARPDGTNEDIRLERSGPGVFTGTTDVGATGTYAVGARVDGPSATLVAGTALASHSFSDEYRLDDPDRSTLAQVSSATGGRGEIESSQAFDVADLTAGRTRTPLRGLLLVLAAVAFLAAVVLSRLTLRGAPVVERARYVGAKTWWRVKRSLPTRPDRADRPAAPPPEPPEPPQSPPRADAAPSSTLGSLLDQQRRRKDGDGGS